jgi:thiol-disulfide isomerase/thioredoxin
MSEEINHNRRHFLTAAALAIGAVPLGLIGCTPQHDTLATARLSVEGELPSLASATAWLNSQPLAAEDLRGKVVLINLWNYTCINWLRQLPFVRAWNEKYKDQSLILIGVHTPEFEFEKNLDNVRRAATEMRVDYAIAVDSDYAIWRAFNNRYWPALYFVDGYGRIRHHQFGEGEYEQSERVIQQLLDEIAAAGVDQGTVSVEARGFEAQADWGSLRSPEIYIGYERTENFKSPGGMVFDKSQTYAVAEELNLNQWSLSGDWTIRKQFARLDKANGRISCGFQARDLHLVLAPAEKGTTVRFRVTLDGKPPGAAAHGLDVDEHGNGSLTEPRLYQLIRQPKPIMARRFEIEFLDAGAEVYAFTFG